MAYSSFNIREIVNKAVSHEWSVPEFQRGFVWNATQVRDLAESLWLGFPVGSILIWDSGLQKKQIEPKNVTDAQLPSLWLVDGQQRATALCILAGRKPYWWANGQDWNAYAQRYDVRFDIHTNEHPYFLVANAAIRRARTNRYVPVSKLITLDLDSEGDQSTLTALAKEIKADGLCDGKDAIEVRTRLERVCRIQSREVVGITVDHDLEQVVEIFARLNSKGTRVREADIYLGVVAARAPGWVREKFMPFLDTLERDGFNVSPNLLFQCLTAVGAKRVRFKQVQDQFWNPTSITPAWERTKTAWQKIVKLLEQYGIVTNGLMPSDAVFIPLAALFDKFQNADRGQIFYWVMQALRYGRYSSSSTTSLDEDLKEIENAPGLESALAAMLGHIRAIEPITSDDFLRDYADSRFGRLLLYVLAFKRGAVDWDRIADRIAFQGTDLVKGYEPQFHHVFPRQFLEGCAKREDIEALANIAIIGAGTNIRISNKDPLDYFVRYDIDERKREQQFVGKDLSELRRENFNIWLRGRAEQLAVASNQLFEQLRGVNQT